MERHPVIVVGAGQGGLAGSHELRRHGVEHVVLERGRIGEAWRSARWDSFCLVTPNWMTRLPGKEYAGAEPDGFMPGSEFVAFLEDYARSFDAPVRCGVEVRRVRRAADGFELETTAGPMACGQVVVATATYQHPFAPALARDLPADLLQVHASEYRNAAALPEGAVLVVGSGQSGCQIAEELHRHGRRVVQCTGRAGRLPRRYRGCDGIRWQHLMGLLDRTPDVLASPALRFRGDPHLTGEGGGRTLNLHRFASEGIQLVGHLCGVHGRTLQFGDDLADNLAFADDYFVDFCARVDAFVAEQGLDVPAADASNTDYGGPVRAQPPATVREIDVDRAGIRAVVWATGFRFDFSWIDAPGGFDEHGYPIQRRGVSDIPGLYYLGLNWLSKRKSGIIFGVGEDARYLGSVIAGRVRASQGAGQEELG
jgi:putative flavoprotein involved in K+ transport